jgi:hypothetical protein
VILQKSMNLPVNPDNSEEMTISIPSELYAKFVNFAEEINMPVEKCLLLLARSALETVNSENVWPPRLPIGDID